MPSTSAADAARAPSTRTRAPPGWLPEQAPGCRLPSACVRPAAPAGGLRKIFLQSSMAHANFLPYSRSISGCAAHNFGLSSSCCPPHRGMPTVDIPAIFCYEFILFLFFCTRAFRAYNSLFPEVVVSKTFLCRGRSILKKVPCARCMSLRAACRRGACSGQAMSARINAALLRSGPPF